MVTTLYLVRHGETEGSEMKRYHGTSDVPLSGRGVEQIRRTSSLILERLKSSSKYTGCVKDIYYPENGGAAGVMSRPVKSPHPPVFTGKEGEILEIDPSDAHDDKSSGLTAVYCSDLKRAVKSAEIIGEQHGLQPLIDRDLRERSFGIWEGLKFGEIRERYPEEFEAWAKNPSGHRPPEGESTLEVKERVIAAFNGILAGHTGETIAMVAHGGVNRIILCHLMGSPLENMFTIEQDYAALNIIEFRERHPVVRLLNGGINV